MKKISACKKSAILATVLGGWMLANTASAANLVVGIASDYTNSQMGMATGSRVTTHVDANVSAGVITGLNRDPATFSVVVDGESKIFMRQYNYSTTELIPSYLFDSQGKVSLDNSLSGVLNSAPNPHGIASAGGYLYIADYDTGSLGVVEITKTGLLNDKGKSLSIMDEIATHCGVDYKAANELAGVHVEGALVDNGYLYIAVNVNPDGGYNTYDDGYLMQYKINFDGSLSYAGYNRIGKNVDCAVINKHNNMLFNIAYGGMQNYGHGNEETQINYTYTNNGTLKGDHNQIIVPQHVKDKAQDFRDLRVLPDGTAYVMTYNLDGSGGGSVMTVYKTTIGNLMAKEPNDWQEIISTDVEGGEEGNASGWFNKLEAEYYTHRLWVEQGDSLVVYTDGDKKPLYTWQTKEFSTNSQLYMWNSLNLIKNDTVFGDTAILTQYQEEGLTSPSVTTVKVVNPDHNLITKYDYRSQITGSSADTAYADVTSDYSKYVFDANKVINLSTTTTGDLTNNINAIVYAKDGNNISIDAGDNTLQLQSRNYIFTPVGVYAGNGKTATIDAGKLNIITVGYEGGNSLTNAIWLDPDAKNSSASKIEINAPVNISIRGGYGGNGIAIQKTNRWGEASYTADSSAQITINGDVSIKGEDNTTWGIPINSENVYSRFNNAGVLTSVEKSKVTINGDVDFDVYGNGVTTNAADSTVTINGGGQITVPKGMNYGYYTLASYIGTINMNTGANGKTPGSDKVVLNGDIFALNTGNINVALTTADSELNGIIDNGGTVNLWLQNGATWDNTAANNRYKEDNEDVGSGEKSHVTSFVGGSSKDKAGVIIQGADSKLLTIDNFSGNATVIYNHDASTPATILGGDIQIKSAAADSGITLRTDNNGIDTTNQTLTNDVLDNLANKLFYTAYANGQKNLTGRVEIAEGLTASSATKVYGDMSFSDSTGQGYLNGQATPDPGNTPGGGEEPDPEPEPTPDPKPTVDLDEHGRLDMRDKADIVYAGDNGIEGALPPTIIYGYDKDNNAVQGGKITINKLDSEGTSQVDVIIDASVVDMTDTTKVEAALNSALAQITNTGKNNISMRLRIVDGLNPDAEILREYNADISAVENGSFNAYNINKAVYKSTVTGDIAVDKEYKYNKGSEWELAKETEIRQVYTDKNADNVHAAIKLNKGLTANAYYVKDIDVNVDVSGLDGANAYGIYNDGSHTFYYDTKTPSSSGGDHHDISINVTGAADGAGIYSADGGKVTIGNSATTSNPSNKLHIDGENIDGVYAGKDGNVTVNFGKLYVNVDADKAGLHANGGTINVNSYYYNEDATDELDTAALAENGGSVNIGRDGRGFNLRGNLVTDATGTIKNNLRSSSAWTGDAIGNVTVSMGGNSIWNGDANGNVNITMDGGSTWNGASLSDKVALELTKGSVWNVGGASTVGTFKGAGSGVAVGSIVQGADDLTINSYSGNSTVIYKHDADETTNIIGGNITIKDAAEGSSITLLTDNSGLNATSEEVDDVVQVSETLNALANKLFYEAYKDGQNNLNGQVVIAEGLTASSASLKVGGITYKENGQGQYEYIPPKVNKFTTAITGGEDKEYADAGVKDDANYTFDNNITITVENGNAVDVNGNNVNINLADNKLTANGGVAATNATLNVTGDATINAAEGVVAGEGGVVSISGATKIADATTAVKVNGANAEVTLAEAELQGSSAVVNAVNGTVNVNMTADKTAGNDKVVVDGDVIVGADGVVNMALNNKDSKFTGVVDSTGATNVWLGNGATWEHDGVSGTSKLASLAGGAASASAGFINQSGNRAIEIGSYSGNTVVAYDHDASDPTNIIGGSITIGSAAVGSGITMMTDNDGLNTGSKYYKDVNLVNATLNALANKLFYTANDGELDGKVMIAESLTASSASLKVGDITYKSDGQGQFVYTEAEPNTSIITGDVNQDQDFVYEGILDPTSNTYTFKDDYALEIDTSKNDVSAIVDLEGKNITLDATGHTLKLDVDDTNNPSGWGGLSGISVRGNELDAKGNIDITVKSNNRGVQGVVVPHKVIDYMAGTSKETTPADVTFNNGLQIDVTGYYDNYGTPVAGEMTANTMGIFVGAKDSVVEVKGDTVIKAQGKGDSNAYGVAVNDLTVNQGLKNDFTGSAVVNLNGADITVTTESDKAYAYAVAAFGGQINVNMDGSNTVVLNGDLCAVAPGGMGVSTADGTGFGNMSEMENQNSNGEINVKLTNADSQLNGVLETRVTKGKDSNDAKINVWLQNGATWNHEVSGYVNTTNKANVSYAASLTGGSKGTEGVIYQNSDRNITVGNYSGSTIVVYDHKADNTTNIIGGNITIKEAADGSSITLYTDRDGLNMESTIAKDVNKVSATMNALANKLFYTGAAGNLAGQVMIGEGLTSSSVSMRVGDITYKADGQGQYEYTPEVTKEFHTALTGDVSTDAEYEEIASVKDGVTTYTFTKGSSIEVEGSYDWNTMAAKNINAVDLNGKKVVIDANGETLSISENVAAGNGGGKTATGIFANGSTATFKGDMAVDVKGDTLAVGVIAPNTVSEGWTNVPASKSEMTFEDDLSVTVGLNGSDYGSSGDVDYEISGIYAGAGSVITVKGNTDVDVTSGTQTDAYGVVVNDTTVGSDPTKAATINLNCADITVKAQGANNEAYALAAYGGAINVNVKDGVAGDDKVVLNGDVFAAEQGSTTDWSGTAKNTNGIVNVALTTADSEFNGVIDSKIAKDKETNGSKVNVWLQNGATWNHEAHGYIDTTSKKDASYAASLTGGSKGSEGIIVQASDRNITVGNYSGNTIVIYEHDKNDVTNVYGGNFTINSAATGSSVTLRTDNVGVDNGDEDSINAALDALANKLFYIGYTTGEENLSGYVQIAEGLTAASVTKQTGDIVYDKTTGQGSLDITTVTPGPTYPTEQVKESFTTAITGDYRTDKEYRKTGVLTADNGIYNFGMDATNVVVETAAVDVDGHNVVLKMNNNSISLTGNDGEAIYVTNGKLDINDAENITVAGSVNADKAAITMNGAANITGDVTANDASTIELNDTTSIKGNIVAANGSNIAISDGKTVEGDVAIVNSGKIVMAMTGKNAKWNGNFQRLDSFSLLDDYPEDGFYLILGDGAQWNGNAEAGMNLTMSGANTTWIGASASADTELTINNGANWNVTGGSVIGSLTGAQGNEKEGSIMMGDGKVTINEYSGSTNVLFGSDATDPSKINGGDLTIEKAKEGSSINLITDRNGMADTDEAVEAKLRALAKKLFYTEDGGSNLNGKVTIAEGLTTPDKEWKLGDISFDGNGQGDVVVGSIKDADPMVIYGDSETAMMRGAKSAMASTAMIWRAEANDMLKRMGDLRMSEGEVGIWAKYYGGKEEMDAQKAYFSNQYNAYQVGYDKKVSDDWIVGAALSYNKGDSTYSRGGDGEQESINMAVYGTMLKEDGRHLDLIAKVGKLSNEYTVYNDMNHKLEGDYDTWAASISAEYGKYFTMDKGFFFDPSAELTIGRVAGKDYSAASDFLDEKGKYKYLDVEQDAFTTVIGRLGFTIGQKLDKASYYAKLSLAHEFAGDYDTTFRAKGEPEGSTSMDFGDTWYELRMGGTTQLSDNSLLYASYGRTFGGDVTENWRVDAGLRFTF